MLEIDDKLDQVVARFDALGAELAQQAEIDPQQYARRAKEYADLAPLIEKIKRLRDLRDEMFDLASLAADAEGDSELRSIAGDEMEALKRSIPVLEDEIKIALLPKDEADERNAIIEIRAGTGGDEAALFAGDLLRMYQRYAELHGWRFEILQISDTGLGGIKEASAEINGAGVFARLKFESGVHRVQRVPQTEASGRIHTSAATVAVLPEAEEIDVDIADKDLRIDVFRSSGPGGQSVNTTDSAVRITHLPTGITVQQQDEKSQHKNRAKAMKILRARLYEAARAESDAVRAEARRSQVGSGDRSERIRTYNFPQGRVTDHRINLTLHKIERILAGEALDDIVDALIADNQAGLLAAVQ